MENNTEATEKEKLQNGHSEKEGKKDQAGVQQGVGSEVEKVLKQLKVSGLRLNADDTFINLHSSQELCQGPAPSLQTSNSPQLLSQSNNNHPSLRRSQMGSYFESKRKQTRAAHSLTVRSEQTRITVDVEKLVSDMSSLYGGVVVKDRKWRLKTYKKCFVGSEAVEWLMTKLKLSDRADAVSVGREIMRLQYFRHVCDDTRDFEDAYLFYTFMGGARVERGEGVYTVRSMEELVALLRQADTGLPIRDHKWHFRTYPNCTVGTDLVDWLMNNLPLRTRKEAVAIGNRLLQEGYIQHLVDQDKPFKDQYLFYQFTERSGASLARLLPNQDEEPEKEASLEDFELLKVLGVGAFGKVMLVRRKKTGLVYAMKALNKTEVAVSERAIRNLKAERNILCNDHPFLVHLHYSFQTQEKLYLVMDYIGGGDLFWHLRQRGKFTEREAAFFAAEVVLALEFLHSYGIIYRDLKPENVLFDKDGHVCLTDFGISKEIGEDKTKTLCGTPSYLAPEILRGEPYGESVDWWSLGVLTNEMLTGRNPFRSKNMHQTMQWIMNKPLVFPDGLSSAATDFISKLLNRDPRARLGCGVTGAREVKCHPFLKQTNWADLSVKRVRSPLKISLSSETDTSYFSSEFTRMPVADEQPQPKRAAGPHSHSPPHHQPSSNLHLHHHNSSKGIISSSAPPAGSSSIAAIAAKAKQPSSRTTNKAPPPDAATLERQFNDWSHTAPTADLL